MSSTKRKTPRNQSNEKMYKVLKALFQRNIKLDVVYTFGKCAYD